MDRDQDLGSDLSDGIFQVAFAGMAGAVGFMQGDAEVGQPIIEYAALVLVFLALEEGLARAVDIVGLLGTDIDELHELVKAGEHDEVALAGPDLAEGDHVAHKSLFLEAVILLGEFAALSQSEVNLKGLVFLWIREIQHFTELIEKKGVFCVYHERPARLHSGLEDRMEPVDVAHGEFAEDQAL